MANRLDLVLLDYQTGNMYTVRSDIQDTPEPDHMLTYASIGGDVMDLVHVLTYSEPVE